MQPPELHQFLLEIMSWITAVRGLAVIGIIGVLCHRFYFIKGEHHLQAPIYLGLWGAVSVSLWFALHIAHLYGLTGDLGSPVRIVTLLESAFLIPLFGSIIVYRVFQHPLCGFNGPPLAAVSKVWHLVYMFFNSNHVFTERLHHKYGNIIRTG